MTIDLHGRHFLKEVDFTPDEWRSLVELTGELKTARREGRERRRLEGLNVALLFEKTSTRTRSAFEVAAHQQGAHVTYMDPSGSQISHKESAADTVRVLGRMFDGIEYRGSRQAIVETMGRYSPVPVWNGLTDEWHPTQSLCDAFTMQEASGKDGHDISFAFLGDARFNMGNSLLTMGAIMGSDVRVVAPRAFQPAADLVARAQRLAERTGARITITDDLAEGVRGADFVHTDVWVSMGEDKGVWAERCRALAPYQVSTRVMEMTQNPDARFMHCLPAFHNLETEVGRQVFQMTGMRELEVTDEVFESKASIVFDQAENRMHSIKAVMVATVGR
ncbi:ornithine carbamoyltransferase [Nigerium massiliense]|uniref:ornithine carbamoyltransferase n=1 Tax=Nigerium massiliense TaxID=1522317 RepID=UPI00058E741C|nr:ornithine carbamoyltransferase [Nigerium massiliense]